MHLALFDSIQWGLGTKPHLCTPFGLAIKHVSNDGRPEKRGLFTSNALDVVERGSIQRRVACGYIGSYEGQTVQDKT